MTTRIEMLDEVLNKLNPELTSIFKAERELDARKSVLANLVADVCEKMPTWEDPDDEENEIEDENIRDRVNMFANDIGQIWSGHYDSYEGWEPGQRPEFWVPSTC